MYVSTRTEYRMNLFIFIIHFKVVVCFFFMCAQLYRIYAHRLFKHMSSDPENIIHIPPSITAEHKHCVWCLWHNAVWKKGCENITGLLCACLLMNPVQTNNRNIRQRKCAKGTKETWIWLSCFGCSVWSRKTSCVFLLGVITSFLLCDCHRACTRCEFKSCVPESHDHQSPEMR